MSASSQAELVVLDQQEPCPYLGGRVARLPLRSPVRQLSREELDARLADGDRRSGRFLYRPKCPQCDACQSLRVDAQHFYPSRSQRRVERRGQQTFEISIGPPRFEPRRVDLFNTHRELRGMADVSDRIDAAGYIAFLVDSCCETLEMTMTVDQQVAAIAIMDRGRHSLSAVYCYYDMAFARYSPGVYAILSQIRLCREWEMKYLYLGYYIAQSPHMSYKAGYLAHERRIDGAWQRFESGG